MQANHLPPYDLKRMLLILQQEWQVIPQETEKVGHVREAALLGLHPHQRWSHTLLLLFSGNNNL